MYFMSHEVSVMIGLYKKEKENKNKENQKDNKSAEFLHFTKF